MRIVILVGLFPPKWLAGTEIATYNIAKYLAKLGHEVHVVTSLDEEVTKEGTEEGFYVHRVGTVRRPNLFILSFFIPALFVVRRIRPDVVHAQSIPMGLCALSIKKLTKIPYIVYSRGESYTSWAFKTIISKQVLKNADAVVALTSHMKRDLSEIYAGHISVIANGIELDKFVGLSRQESRVRLKISGENRVIIFVGRFRPEKNVACLIEAMGIIAGTHPKVKLFLVGDGPEKGKLKALAKKLRIEKQVNFVGQLPHSEVPKYLAAADVFVLPSLSEGFPVVSLEAMASGLPIVATRVTGIPEIVTDSENGLLVEPEKPEQVAEAVLKILGNSELATKMSENNKVRVKQYSWRTTCQQLEAIYLQVIESQY